MNVRDTLASIGEDLIEAASSSAPLNTVRIGDLMAKLALAYGQLVNAERRPQR